MKREKYERCQKVYIESPYLEQLNESEYEELNNAHWALICIGDIFTINKLNF